MRILINGLIFDTKITPIAIQFEDSSDMRATGQYLAESATNTELSIFYAGPDGGDVDTFIKPLLT